MVDLVQVGASFDTSGLEAGAKATDQLTDALQRAASTSSELTKNQSDLSNAQQTAANAAQAAAQATEKLAVSQEKIQDVAEAIDRMGETYEQMASSVEQFGESAEEALKGSAEAAEEYANANVKATDSLSSLIAKQQQVAASAAAANAEFLRRQTASPVADALDVNALKQKYGTATAEIETAMQATMLSYDRMAQDMANRTGQSVDQIREKMASWGTSTANVLAGISKGTIEGADAEGKLGEAVSKNSGFFSSLLGSLTGYGGAQRSATEAVRGNATAHGELEGKAGATSGIFGTLRGILGGYGSAHDEVKGKVHESSHAHSELTEATREFAHIIHALHPELASAGVGMGELSGFARVARSGIALLTAAIAGTFIVEVVKTRGEMEHLKDTFNSVFGEAGPEMLEKTEEAAKHLGTTLDRLAPSVQGVYDSLRKGAISQEMDQKEALNLNGWSFTSGEAGQQAMRSMLDSSREIVVSASSQTGKEIQKLQDLFQATGVSADTAFRQVAQFWANIPTTAEEARSASVKATEEMVKLFEMAGKGGDDAAAATSKFFGEVRKAGLTSDTFDKLAQDSRIAAQTIAEGFGFKGPEAIERFSVALERVKGVSFGELLAGLSNVEEKVEEMHPKDTLSRAWGEVKTAFRETFEEIVKGIESTEDAASQAEGGASVKFLKGIADGIKAITPYIVEEINKDIHALVETIKELKEVYEWFQSVQESTAQGATAGIAAGAIAGGAIAGPPGALVGGVAGGFLGGDIGSGNMQRRIDAAGGVGGTEFMDMGAFQSPGKAGAGTVDYNAQQAQSATEGFDQALESTKSSADQAKISSDALSTSLASFGDESGNALENSRNLSEAMSNANESLDQTAQSAPNSVNTAQSSLQAFFDWLIQAAEDVAAAQSSVNSGGGGPQLDQSGAEADIGSNATGGIYTVGATGGVAGGSTRASGTDTITLKGSVSPGEIVAVIPADKANATTMSALQTIVSDVPPISIGGGNVSGSDTTTNVTAILGSLLDGTGSAYPAALSDPQIKNLLAQIKALVAAGKNKSLSNNATATSGLMQQGGGVQYQPNDDNKKKNNQQQQQKQEKNPDDGSSSSRGRANPTSRAAKPADAVIRLPKMPKGIDENKDIFDENFRNATAFPASDTIGSEYQDAGLYYGGDQDLYDPYFSSYDLPYNDQFYDPYSAYSGAGIGYGDSSYDLPYTDQFYNPYSANADPNEGYGYAFDNSDYFSSYQNYDASSYVPYDDPENSYGAVDIGANATGGIYTIGGNGQTDGYSGKTDALQLVGRVSPGEIVAVIPAEKNNSATLAALKGLTGTHVTSLGGGGARQLSLSNDQVNAALEKIKALIAAQLATNLASKPASSSAGAGGGGGFNTAPSEKKDNQQQQQKQDKNPDDGSGSSRGRANPTSRAAKPASNAVIRLPKMPKDKGGEKDSSEKEREDSGAPTTSQLYGYDAYRDAGPYYGGGQDMYDANFASYNLPYDDYFYDPYSAYAGDGFGYGGNSYDLPYDNYFYDPYSANSPYDYGDYSFNNSDYLSGLDQYGNDYGSNSYSDYGDGSSYTPMGDYTGYGDSAYSGNAYSSYDNSDYLSGLDQYGGGYDNGGYTAMGDYGGGSYYDPEDYATGGSFIVPPVGGGGTDTVRMPLNLTEGETVAIWPAGADPQRATTAIDQTPGAMRGIPGFTLPSDITLSDTAPIGQMLSGSDKSTDISTSPDKPRKGGDQINVNVFGVRNVNEFHASRMSITRAMRSARG